MSRRFVPGSTVNDTSPQEQPTPDEREANIDDRLSMALLIFLYVLQGIPMGLAGSVPLLLQEKGATYAQQSIFSLVSWPFSLKLLWAPLVDSLFIEGCGRRKSWLVPVQCLVGVMMVMGAPLVTSLLDEGRVGALAAYFFALYFLMATQDVAVDGWALTMLSPRNVGHASTCNTIGQTGGYFVAFSVFLALSSPDFCNAYLRPSPAEAGLVTLGGFMSFWGWVFLASTALLLLKEEAPPSAEESATSTLEVYRQAVAVARLPAVIKLVVVLLTWKMAFAAADGLTQFELMRRGLPKEHLALILVGLTPVHLALPVLVGKWISGTHPLRLCLRAYPFRVALALCGALLVWSVPPVTHPGERPSTVVYVAAVALLFLYSCASTVHFVATMAFNAQISDPAIGGTYMTLLNTFANLGGKWPVTVALAAVDTLTWRRCALPDGSALNLPCSAELEHVCVSAGGECETTVNGYYVVSILCAIVGVVWLALFWQLVSNMTAGPQWRVKSRMDLPS